MRTIDRSSAFKRDYKRESKRQHRDTLDDVLKAVLLALATDQPLDGRYRDHGLSGNWAVVLSSAARRWTASFSDSGRRRA